MDEKTENSSANSVEEDVIPGYSTVSDFTKDGFKCLMEGIKHANSLPSGRDWNFYKTFDSFTKTINEESQVIMDGITSILKKNEVGANMRNQTIEHKTEILIDANDVIFERVANNIDEMNGICKTVNEPIVLQTVSAQLPVNVNGSWNRSGGAKFSVTKSFSSIPGVSSVPSKSTIRLLTAENIVRPQKFFKDKIDNRNDYAWEPRIKEKPNSLKPLAIFLEETEKGNQYSHPYEFELDRFTPSDALLTKTKISNPKPLKDTPLVEICKPEELPGLLQELMKFKILAVDLEHHSYRSFMGITCLLQISTSEKDYLIDTLALRNDLWILNEVFTKSDIIKVFHGAESDILWLQRDLSLYIVNMFDTHFAAKHLDYSGLSLAYLMQRFCKFLPNKQFQLADWRIRPLPEELKNYAREDTHYLIYIYQNMRNELIDKANGKTNLLKSVIDSSTALCKKRYVKPLWHEEIHLEFYRRCHRMFDNRQLFALKHIYKWRDNIARTEDESTGYVLPNNMLLEIAGRLPKEMQGILACCSPVPPLVKANLLEIHKIILKALEQPFEEPILKEDTRARGSIRKMTKINVDSPLHCPHDLTKNRENLPTLLNFNNKENVHELIFKELQTEKTKSIFSVFNISKKLNTEKESQAIEKLRKFKENFKFLGPFERYKLVKPFIQAKEKKLAEEKAKQESVKNEANKSNNIAGEEDTRTDEERIESIREHFLSLARQTLPPQTEPPKNQSLLEMGGTRKRKRDESILRGSNMQPDGDVSDINLQTTVPNLQITLHRNVDSSNVSENEQSECKKRKINDDEASPGPKLSRRQIRKMKMDKRALAKQPRNESLEDPNNSIQNMVHQESVRRRKGKGRGHYKNKNNQSEFNAYDYSMVDFRQFQGGAGRVENPKEFRSNFKGIGKANKRGGKGHNNRSMNFGPRRRR